MAVASTAKGEARRAALLDGMLRVLERDGAGGVTHRSVAAEAGVPLAAATYYFATLDDLFIEGLRRATLDQLRLFESLGSGTIHDLAVALHRWVHLERATAIAQYELLFVAMRRDSLRVDADAWYDALESAVATRVPGVSVRLVTLAIDGLLLRMLWRGDPATVQQTEVVLREILGTQRPG